MDSLPAHHQRFNQSDASAPEGIKDGVSRPRECENVLLDDAPYLLREIAMNPKMALCGLFLERGYLRWRNYGQIVKFLLRRGGKVRRRVGSVEVALAGAR